MRESGKEKICPEKGEQSAGVIVGCQLPKIACRSWCEKMETGEERRMTGAVENGGWLG